MRILKLTTSVLLLFLLFSSCKNKKEEPAILDFSPIDVAIYVHDKNGQDALANGTIDTEKITINSKGRDFGVYDIKTFEDILFEVYHGSKLVHPKPAPIRAFGPVKFYGAGILVDDAAGDNFILIGNYNGDKEYDKEPITITWPDGSKDKIEFSHSIDTNGKSIKVFDVIYVNGLQVNTELTVRIEK